MTRDQIEEFKNRIWEDLGLKDRAIIFHQIEMGDNAKYSHFSPDLVDEWDDLYDSDEFFEITLERWNEKTIEVLQVDSFMLGDGEADHADSDDIEYLGLRYYENPNLLDAVLEEYADLLVRLTDGKLENSNYEEDEEA